MTLAAAIGCQGVALNPATINIDLGGPISRLDHDPAVRRATAQALAATGVKIDLVDALGIVPKFSLAENAAMLKIFRELGATRFNIVVMDSEMSRVRENLAAVCDLAKSIGMLPMLEFSGLGGPIGSLKVAAALAASGEYPGLKLMIDSLHLARCGETPAYIAAIDPALIGAAQICDGPLSHPGKDAYRYEALFERGIPARASCRCWISSEHSGRCARVAGSAAQGAARKRRVYPGMRAPCGRRHTAPGCIAALGIHHRARSFRRAAAQRSKTGCAVWKSVAC